MKKILFILLILITLTACSRDGYYSCNHVFFDEEGYKIDDTFELYYNDQDIVTQLTEVSLTYMNSEEEVLESIYYSSEIKEALNNINGIYVDYIQYKPKVLKYVLMLDYENLDIDSLTQLFNNEDLSESMYIKAFNITVSEFKSKYLGEYICK